MYQEAKIAQNGQTVPPRGAGKCRGLESMTGFVNR
jgi:hypothetical protein